MPPGQTYTVENYLKAVYQAQQALGDPDAMVPMGQLASALDVVPGTATTMVKALAESGLVQYEPYVGVRLTRAGERLAALVLRRHRLIELFLVKVMGMSWTEVHDEAEHLEHAVSDRLIDRIDAMLGRPDTDPHGDPIPDPKGQLVVPHYQTLLTCPMQVPVKVTRIVDQDAAFLQFLEDSQLKPGEIVHIKHRDAAADRVTLTRRDDVITLGTRAAAKLMVQVATVLILAAGSLVAPLSAQQAPAPATASRPFEIQDNSFLVEEAFNQERGVFQNIFGFSRGADAWEFVFTQEWPVPSQTHQFSYTMPFGGYGETTGVGDMLLNYRYQAWTETSSRPAFSPRISLILPTGGLSRGHDRVGFQINLPFSKQVGDWYFHWNGGFTDHPKVDALDGGHTTLFTPHAAASAIWRARPMVHLMLESLLVSREDVLGRRSFLTFSPGVRIGKNHGDAQVVMGAGLPVTFREGDSSAALLLYLSYERPFKH